MKKYIQIEIIEIYMKKKQREVKNKDQIIQTLLFKTEEEGVPNF